MKFIHYSNPVDLIMQMIALKQEHPNAQFEIIEQDDWGDVENNTTVCQDLNIVFLRKGWVKPDAALYNVYLKW